MTQLDEHGARILAFVESYQRQHQRSPTYREIGAAIGLLSSDHVARDVRRLVNQGYISFTPGVSRSIVLLKTPRAVSRGTLARTQALPLPHFETNAAPPPKRDELGEIAAGLFQDEQDTFLLRVRGAAMQDALLEDGDMVVVKRGENFHDGEMLAVYLRPEKRTTLKYLYRENGRVRAQAPNPAAPPAHFRASDLEIRGTVLAILRKREL